MPQISTYLPAPTLSYTEQLDALKTANTVCLPQSLGIIQVQGADSVRFLHAQLTNAVEGLAANELRLGGYCSVKGRLLASAWYWHGDPVIENGLPTIYLLVSQDLLAPLQKRLSMFVLRDKVKLRDVSAEFTLLGLTGSTFATNLAEWFPNLPSKNQVLHHAEVGSLLHMSDAQTPRYLWMVPVAQTQTVAEKLGQTLTVISDAAWSYLEVQTAIPRIVLATQDQFVPQMINFEVIGGVNFKKGCYPGQEIVARSQYRGTIKRRLQLAQLRTSLETSIDNILAGTEIFHSSDPQQPCGMVVLAAPSANGYALQIECKLEALQSGHLYLNNAPALPLIIEPLPYTLPTEQ